MDRQAIDQKVASTLQTSLHDITVQPSWLDKDLQRANDQTATISLLGYPAFIATAIATPGLLGLVTYTVQVRRKRSAYGKSSEQRENSL